jgi:SAM-dependent methyltransferase
LTEILPVIGLLLILVGIALLSILWTSSRGAPWFPTPVATGHKMLSLAGVRPGEVVYDLGSGDGRLLFAAARRFGARAVGIELDPFRYLWTQILITLLGMRGQVRVRWGDLFGQDLSQADVVTVYLLPAANARLMIKLRQELRPGARVVCYKFFFPGWRPVSTDEENQLYLYRVGGRSG